MLKVSQPEILDFFDKTNLSLVQNAQLAHELALWKCGFSHIAGVDEAGRGPLAGPVVACACILPKGVAFHGIKDSKELSPKERKKLSDFLTTHPDIHWSIGIASNEEIDRINILKATLQAMRQAVDGLKQKPDFLLVDGRDKPPTEIECRPIIRGDSLSQSIGAASIIAKVYRDDLMEQYHKQYPLYGFDKHKGYGTALHRKAIEKYGLLPIHRLSFRSSKEEQPTLF